MIDPKDGVKGKVYERGMVEGVRDGVREEKSRGTLCSCVTVDKSTVT